MRIRLLSLALPLSLVLAAPLRAQPTTSASAAAPAAAIAPSHLAAAKEYLAQVGVLDMAMTGAQMAMDQQIAQNPALRPYRDAMLAWARDLFGSEEAGTAFATLYAEVFTEAEIRQLMEFARTPVGRKASANQTVLAQRGAELGQRLAQSHQADLFARIQQAEAADKQD